MNRFLTLFLTPFVAILLIALKIPEFDCLIKGIHPKAPLVISIFLVVATVFNYYVYIYAPYKNFERMAKNKWTTLDEKIKEVIDAYSISYGIDLTVNIMIPKLRFWYSIDIKDNNPFKRKFSFWGKVFDPIYQDGSIPIDHRLKITTNQGVCGEVYNSGSRVRGVLLNEPSVALNFNFNDLQMELTKGIVMLACCAITVKTNEVNRQKSKVIGVLSFESKMLESEQLLSNREARVRFFKSIESVANLYKSLI